jgi:hypothetical protein
VTYSVTSLNGLTQKFTLKALHRMRSSFCPELKTVDRTHSISNRDNCRGEPTLASRHCRRCLYVYVWYGTYIPE